MTPSSLFLRSGLALALACAFAAPAHAGPVGTAPVVYSNGDVVDGSGLSVLNAPAGTFGYGAQRSSNNRVADNFFIPDGETWRVGSISLFAYQTGATAFSFTTADWQIVTGDLDSPTPVASGSDVAVTDEGRVGYRVQDSSLNDTSRPIYQIGVDIPDVDLAPGSYWLIWSIGGSLSSGPWVPVLALGGDSNAEQSVNLQAFARVVDQGTGLNAELPFQLNGATGHANGVPEPTSLALVLAAGLAAAAARRRSV